MIVLALLICWAILTMNRYKRLSFQHYPSRLEDCTRFNHSFPVIHWGLTSIPKMLKDACAEKDNQSKQNQSNRATTEHRQVHRRPEPLYTEKHKVFCHYAHMNNHSLENTEEEPIRARLERSRTRTHEVPFIAGRSHFTRKNTRFPAPAFPQNEAHVTSVQP